MKANDTSSSTLVRRLFARKSTDPTLGPDGAEGGLRRALGKWQVTGLGVGAIIGAGIFATTGSAIAGGAGHTGAGPAIVVSFFMTAVACGFAALCYAEFAAMVPVAGSAYTYAYAALGELVAWIIGWDLILEYAVGNVAVAISWSGYFNELVSHFGITLPGWLSTDYRTAIDAASQGAGGAVNISLATALESAPRLLGVPIIVNLPAVIIVALITAVLVYGVRESARMNSAIVIVKIAIVLFFIGIGAAYISPENFVAHGGFAPNGFTGISSAAAIIFFAYIGFDAVSTAAEETKDPGRDMPFGILMSLAICTILYILVGAVMTGMAPWDALATAEPMVTALELANGNPRILAAAQFIIAFGAVMAMTSVLLVFQLGQPRIFFSMARDGLLPHWAAKVHPRFQTPHVTTILTGVVVAFFAAFANINEAVELTNIGTLFAFVLVAGGIIVLRAQEPDRPRPFRVPASPFIPLMAILSCGYLMLQLPRVTWIRFVVWLAIGIAVYFGFGYKRSNMRRNTA